MISEIFKSKCMFTTIVLKIEAWQSVICDRQKSSVPVLESTSPSREIIKELS